MIEIEQGKVYRLHGDNQGLFVAEHRHEDKHDSELDHWLMRRITKPGGWDGWADPLIYDRFRDLYVLREATEEDYDKYIERYDKEMDDLFGQVSDINYIKLQLEDRKDELWSN